MPITVDDKAARERINQKNYRDRELASNPNYFNDLYQKNKEKIQDFNRKNKDRIKTEVLTHYGQGKLACIRCGETRFPALSIDHLNNNGTEERKRPGKAGLGFYYWLKNQGYPEEYQTLCMNCQFVKREEVFLLKLKRRKEICPLL